MIVDSSVLIAATIEGHPHHGASNSFVHKVKNGKYVGALATHSLAECYSALSAMPITPMISPQDAQTIIERNFLPYFEIISLDVADYRAAIARVAERNLRSGVVYDALIVQLALKRKATHIITWNHRHFKRLAPDKLRVVSPSDL